MMVNIETLDVGDEILIPLLGCFRRLIIKRPIKKSTKRQWGTYSSVKCEILDQNNLDDYTVLEERFQDLNYKEIWLIKKGKL
jgi:hypothetical protein